MKQRHKVTRKWPITVCRRPDGLLVSAVDSRLSSPGSNCCQGQCIVLLGEKLCSLSAFLHPVVLANFMLTTLAFLWEGGRQALFTLNNHCSLTLPFYEKSAVWFKRTIFYKQKKPHAHTQKAKQTKLFSKWKLKNMNSIPVYIITCRTLTLPVAY